MTNKAVRRVKGKRSNTGRAWGFGSLGSLYSRLRFPLLVVLSAVLHLLVLWLISVLPALFHLPQEEMVIFSIEMTSVPGPQGGGGESSEVVEPPKKPEPPKEITEPVEKPSREEVVVPKEKPKAPARSEPKATDKPADKPAVRPEPAAPKQAPVGPGVGPAGGGIEGAEGPVTVAGGKPFPFPEYIEQIKRKVGSVWKRRQGEQHVRKETPVEVTFSIDRSGRVTDVKVTGSSKNGVVDRFAMSVIKDASPFDRLPEGYDGKHLGVQYRFRITP